MKVRSILSRGLLLMLFIGAGAGIGWTLASWHGGSELAAGTISSGSLGLEPDGDARWYDASPENSDPVTIDPATFLASPGDRLTGTRTFAQTGSGDNLEARITVSATAGSLPSGVSVSYSVVVDGATVIEDAALGSQQLLPPSTALTRSIGLTITVDYAATAPEHVGSPAPSIDIGTFDIDVQQTRPGTKV